MKNGVLFHVAHVSQLFMQCGDPLGSAMEAVKMDNKCSLAHSSVGILCCQSNAMPFSSTRVLNSLKLARSTQTTTRDKVFASALECATRGHVCFKPNQFIIL